MNQPKPLSLLVLVCLLTALSVVSAVAQADDKSRAEPNYEVTLHVLVGSNDPSSKADIPANLGNVTRQLRSTFGFANYRVASTFLGRIGNNGNFEYKSTVDLQGRESGEDALTFLDWSLANFRSVPNGFRAQAFRFGSRVPVRTAGTKDDGGKPLYVINYESIGLTIANVGVPENIPTLLGTLSMPRTSGMLFLVMTVTPADK